MAIIYTREFERLEVLNHGAISVTYREFFDDPDDNMLPTRTIKNFHIEPHSDVSGHDDIVKRVCEAVWVDVDLPPQMPEGE